MRWSRRCAIRTRRCGARRCERWRDGAITTGTHIPTRIRTPTRIPIRTRVRTGTELSRFRGRRRERARERLGRRLHLFERADRDAHVALLVRREVARDQHAFLAAGVAELARRALHVDEDEVALRVGRLEAALLEPVD